MARKKCYKTIITECCENAGTYKPCMDKVIEQLADILGRRDKLLAEWKADGEPFVKEQENTRGATYMAKDLRVETISKLEDSALKHWIALGVTPRAAQVSAEPKKDGKAILGSLMAEAKKNVKKAK